MPAFMFPKDDAPPPRILVREECRERWGNYVCDGRRPMREIMPEFPNFDFSELEHDEDVFYTEEREPEAHTCARAVQFLEWLNKRPEKCIAVVTHSSFLKHMFMQVPRGTILRNRNGRIFLRCVALRLFFCFTRHDAFCFYHCHG